MPKNSAFRVRPFPNGRAAPTQPELSKLIELSKLYSVSVDELLSLEHAKPEQDAAESPVQSNAEKAPAEKLSFRDFCIQHKKIASGAVIALAALIAVGVHYNNRITRSACK